MDPWGKIATYSHETLRELQNIKLHQFFNTQLYPFSAHYRRLFDRHKINPRKIKTVKDLKHIPFTSKLDFISQQQPEKFKDFILQPDQEKIRKAWGKTKLLNLAVSSLIKGKSFVQEQISREYRPVFMTFTTGTTNMPVAFIYSDYDMNNLKLSGSRMLNLFNITADDRVVNMFPYAPHLAFWQVVFGGFSSCVFILSTGGGKTVGTEGNIRALERMKPVVILGVPSYVYHVLRTAKEKGCQMPFIKKVVLGASRVPDAFKVKLAELLESMGAKDVCVFGTYGFTEAKSAWAECPTHNDISSGYHLYPDKEIIEIINPDTGEVKGEGEDGEIVYTTLDARGSIVIRYRTGDFVKGGITYKPCPHCKRTVPRLSSDITRISSIKDLNLSKVKGALIDFDNFDPLLAEFPAVYEWQIELRKKNNDPFDVDELIIYVYTKDGTNRERLASDIKNRISTVMEITPNDIIFIPFDEIIKRLELETAHKEKRVLDKRPK